MPDSIDHSKHKEDRRVPTNSPSSNKNTSFFQDLPERLKKMIINLEKNYKIIERESSGIKLNIKRYEKSKDLIFSNYNKKEKTFLESIFAILINRESHWLSNRVLENQFYHHFKKEIKNIPDTLISSRKKSQEKDKTRGIRGYPPPHPSSNGDKEEESSNYLTIRNMPLSKVSKEIEGEIYKKKIYISKHCLEHFTTLSAKFHLVKDHQGELYIFNKLEKFLKPNYNRFGWAWAIDKEKQAKLGICFNVQIHQKGTFIIWIKKGFKDIETFLEHYYMIFNFLDYEEHKTLLELFYISKTERKAFDYIHLANKIGPKQTIDKEWKGAEISVEYFTLKSGKKVINVKIDYSDPHDPELEIQGSEAESRNLRDILIKPAETLPTINNIGIWSLEARNNTKDIKMGHEIIKEHIINHGQIFETLQFEINNNHQDNLAQISQLEAKLMNHDLQEELRKLDLRERIEFIKRRLPHLEESIINIYSEGSKERIEIREALINLIVHLLNLDNNIQGNIESTKNLIEKTFFDTTIEIHNAKKEIVDSFTKKLDSFKLDFQKIFHNEFQNLRKNYTNNLYLMIRAIHNIPDITTKELIKEIKDELNVSRSTIYNYLKKLQKKEIINKNKSQVSKIGRPSHVYRISDKFRNLFNKKIRGN